MFLRRHLSLDLRHFAFLGPLLTAQNCRIILVTVSDFNWCFCMSLCVCVSVCVCVLVCVFVGDFFSSCVFVCMCVCSSL